MPYVKRWASRFLTEKKRITERVDAQIAELHKQRKSTFYVALGLEFMARIVGCAEVFFILNILTDHVSLPGLYPDYGLHFLVCQPVLLSRPCSFGAREGGFALAVGGLAIPSAFGIYTGLITRVRELIWIVIGVLLMKVGNGTPNKTKDE